MDSEQWAFLGILSFAIPKYGVPQGCHMDRYSRSPSLFQWVTEDPVKVCLCIKDPMALVAKRMEL